MTASAVALPPTSAGTSHSGAGTASTATTTWGEWAFCLGFAAFIWGAGFVLGHTTAAKVCAAVPGQVVISATADECTYVRGFGLATKKRKAK